MLMNHFLAYLPQSLEGEPSLKISDDAVEMLMDYRWPGNIRELENILERASVLAENGWITCHELPNKITTPDFNPALPFATPHSRANIVQIEKEMLLRALRENDWNQSKTADQLGMKRATLQYRMQKYGISRETLDSLASNAD